jgi:hypothetical protein
MLIGQDQYRMKWRLLQIKNRTHMQIIFLIMKLKVQLGLVDIHRLTVETIVVDNYSALTAIIQPRRRILRMIHQLTPL